MIRLRDSLIVSMLVLLVACAQQAPTIAHVHLGHSITGAFDTPDRIGYLAYAEQLAEQALASADAAVADGASLAQIQSSVARADELTAVEIGRGARRQKVILEAVSHVEFAATSPDASANVVAGFKQFDESVQGMLVRGELITSYSADIQDRDDAAEAYPLALEVQKLAYANVYGEDLSGNGVIGDSARELGLRQISETMEAIIADETPPYATVDRWFLFNLIRLPNGDWIFRRPSDPAGDPY